MKTPYLFPIPLFRYRFFFRFFFFPPSYHFVMVWADKLFHS